MREPLTPQASTNIATAVTRAYSQFNQSTAAERVQPAIDEVRQSQRELRSEIAEVQAELSSSPGDLGAQARIQALTAELLLTESTARRLSIEAQASGIDLVEQARIPEEPIQPRPVRSAALGGALGFVTAAALAGVLSRRRRRLDPATVLGAPLLATIPDFNPAGGMAIEQLLDSEAAEAYQFLVAPFEYASHSATCIRSS